MQEERILLKGRAPRPDLVHYFLQLTRAHSVWKEDLRGANMRKAARFCPCFKAESQTLQAGLKLAG